MKAKKVVKTTLAILTTAILAVGCGSENNRVNANTFDPRFEGQPNTALSEIQQVKNQFPCSGAVTKREILVTGVPTSFGATNNIQVSGTLNNSNVALPQYPISKQFVGMNSLNDFLVVTEFATGNGNADYLLQFDFCNLPATNLGAIQGAVNLDTDANQTLGDIDAANLYINEATTQTPYYFIFRKISNFL